MNARTKIIFEVLDSMIEVFDHEGPPWGLQFGKPTVMFIDIHEYESRSGNHIVTTNLTPDIIDRHGHYYMVIPIALVYAGWKRLHVEGALDELPKELRDFLGKLNGLPAKLSEYDVSFLIPLLNRAGLGYFVWWTSGASRSNSILIVQAPHTEREAAEWIAEWLKEKIPEYIATRIKL